MEGLLPRSVVDSIRRTAKGLKGFPRRVFQAVVTKEYSEGKPRKAETLFGWNRDAVRQPANKNVPTNPQQFEKC